MGFNTPMDRWLRGPLRDWGEAQLDESRLGREGFLMSGKCAVFGVSINNTGVAGPTCFGAYSCFRPGMKPIGINRHRTFE
jgi:hypothetical protein